MIRRLTFIMLVVALAAAQDRPTFRIKVDMVVLSFTITDNKGHYVNGLKPSDFRILEDGITQKVSTFSDIKLFRNFSEVSGSLRSADMKLIISIPESKPHSVRSSTSLATRSISM